MMNQKLVRIAFAGMTTLALLTTGCGGGTPNGYDPYATDPYGTDPYGSDPYGGSTGGSYGSDPYGGSTGGSYGGGYGGSTGGSYGGGYGGATGGGTYGGYPTGVPVPGTGELKVGGLDKTSKGILFWKKLVVTGQVQNPSQAVLSGEVQISFTKKGKVVETQTEFVTDLAPGQSHSFTVTSKKSADDVQVSVTSQPGQSAGGYGGGSGYGGGTGGSYGGGYGGSTGGYGGSTGGSYGGGYGGSTGGGYGGSTGGGYGGGY